MTSRNTILAVDATEAVFRKQFYHDVPYHLRKYTAAWVLVRCVSHGFESAQKMKNYEEAVRLLKFLLETEG